MAEKKSTTTSDAPTARLMSTEEPELGGPSPDQSLPPLAEDVQPVCATCGFDPDSTEERETNAEVETPPDPPEGMGEPIEEVRVVEAPMCPTCGNPMDVNDISNLRLVSKH